MKIVGAVYSGTGSECLPVIFEEGENDSDDFRRNVRNTSGFDNERGRLSRIEDVVGAGTE